MMNLSVSFLSGNLMVTVTVSVCFQFFQSLTLLHHCFTFVGLACILIALVITITLHEPLQPIAPEFTNRTNEMLRTDGYPLPKFADGG